ncbi:hypothetical protein VNO77_00636 [Canavalia gladiata]|uniref:Coiled-coil domain-containing protein SCD2 n=1 Tax=Canavalia gladiata TaxID=3824 RepID=A0AAN9R9H8_CANGL
MSPAHPHSRQRNEAAQRLAQVMAYQTVDDDDDFEFRTPSAPSSSSNNANGGNNGFSAIHPILASRRSISPSPSVIPTAIVSYAAFLYRAYFLEFACSVWKMKMLGRNFVEDNHSVRSSSAGRTVGSMRSTMVVVPSKSTQRMPVLIPPMDPPTNSRSTDRFPSYIGQLSLKDTGNQREAFALRDELDMLQEENEIIVEKLRHAEKIREEAEARARELEKQVASLGDVVSREALGRREAALHRKEVAFKAAKQIQDQRDAAMTALHVEIQNLKDDAATAIEQQQEAEADAKAVHTVTQRMILTQEEMEEVVLKRCWLARYWGLAVKHGICVDVARSKHDHWSSLAPLPFEFVTSAGQKAKEESWEKRHESGTYDPDRSKPVRDLSDLTGEGNIESMLSVDMGLRELASLKVEDAVVLALAQHRRPNFVRQSILDSTSLGDLKFMEAFELSHEEREDVLFKECTSLYDNSTFISTGICLMFTKWKEGTSSLNWILPEVAPDDGLDKISFAWLTYFWRRALFHGVEEDVAEEHLQFWISRSGQSPTSLDAVDVERGLFELRKLGIEQQLWEASRKEIDQLPVLAVANFKLSTGSEASF